MVKKKKKSHEKTGSSIYNTDPKVFHKRLEDGIRYNELIKNWSKEYGRERILKGEIIDLFDEIQLDNDLFTKKASLFYIGVLPIVNEIVDDYNDLLITYHAVVEQIQRVSSKEEREVIRNYIIRLQSLKTNIKRTLDIKDKSIRLLVIEHWKEYMGIYKGLWKSYEGLEGVTGIEILRRFALDNSYGHFQSIRDFEKKVNVESDKGLGQLRAINDKCRRFIKELELKLQYTKDDLIREREKLKKQLLEKDMELQEKDIELNKLIQKTKLYEDQFDSEEKKDNVFQFTLKETFKRKHPLITDFEPYEKIIDCFMQDTEKWYSIAELTDFTDHDGRMEHYYLRKLENDDILKNRKNNKFVEWHLIAI